MQRALILGGAGLVLLVLGVIGLRYMVHHAVDSALGPVHRFPVPEGETFLTDDRAAAVAREVMNRDGYPETAWRLLEDGRSKSPDGLPDVYLARNASNPNQGYVTFRSDDAAQPQRTVNLELRDGEIEASGRLVK
jgi:hypothetical protein